MKPKVSRRKLAQYVIGQIQDGRIPEAVLQELAAYIIDTHREREIELIVRAIETELEASGTTIATVSTARDMADELRPIIINLIGDPQVYLRERVEPKLLSGVRIDTPSKRYDTTGLKALSVLRAAKH